VSLTKSSGKNRDLAVYSCVQLQAPVVISMVVDLGLYLQLAKLYVQ